MRRLQDLVQITKLAQCWKHHTYATDKILAGAHTSSAEGKVHMHKYALHTATLLVKAAARRSCSTNAAERLLKTMDQSKYVRVTTGETKTKRTREG